MITDVTGLLFRRTHVTRLHKADPLTGHAAYLQRLAIELAFEWVQRLHDVADRAVSMGRRLWRLGLFGLLPDARVGLTNHLFAEVDAHHVFLKDVVVEHVFGSFA